MPAAALQSVLDGRFAEVLQFREKPAREALPAGVLVPFPPRGPEYGLRAAGAGTRSLRPILRRPVARNEPRGCRLVGKPGLLATPARHAAPCRAAKTAHRKHF